MKNKLLINKIKNAAELAMAAYGYYDLMTNDTNQLFIVLKDEKGKDRIDSNKNPITKEITLTDIMDSNYAEHNVVGKDKWGKDFKKVGTLKGDMTPTQVKRFFDKYDLLDFYPKFDNKNNKQQKGFHACLFQDKESKEYTLAIRGSFDSKDYVEADYLNLLARSSVPKDYFEKMLNFYYQCAEKYPAITKPKSLNVVGHSLGGALAQMFVLSFADYAKGDCGILNEVYTFNSPGARDLSIDAFGVIDIDLANLSSDNKEIREKKIEQYIHSLDLQTITQRFIKKLQRFGIKASYSDGLLVITEQLKRFLGFKYNQEYRAGLKVELRTIQENGSLLKTYEPYFIEIDSLYVNAYNNLIDNYHFHREKRQGVDIGLPTHHIETDSDNNPNNKENNNIQNLGEDIDGKHYYLNIGIDIKGMDSHSIKSSVIILYFYEYLLDLETNREKLSNRIKELETNPKDPAILNYIGYKAAKNKGKYQLITALLNDFMQWNYNSLREVNEVVLSEVKNKYKEQKKNDKNTSNPPKKIFPLVYLLNEVSYIARFKNSKDIEEFNIYKMIDLITQLQEAKIYIRILDKKFFDELENKQCSVAELRSVLKCQPFMVVDENNKEILNESNRAEIFYYKTFNNLVSQILQSYKTA